MLNSRRMTKVTHTTHINNSTKEKKLNHIIRYTYRVNHVRQRGTKYNDLNKILNIKENSKEIIIKIINM